MRTALAILLVTAACSSPEARTAARVLGCLGARDESCLRKYHAPLVPRLRAWAASARVDALFVGHYARRAMRDADNPYWTVSPVACAQRAQAGNLPAAGDLRDCRCKTVASRKVAPREVRSAAFERVRERAVKLHPAMEILANRSTAEALRVEHLAEIECRCGARTVRVAMLDLNGRVPVWRYFHATGICGADDRDGLRSAMDRAGRLVSGDLREP